MDSHLQDSHLQFTPIKGLSNPHVQTVLPRFLRRTPLFSPCTQRLTTPDGDFVDLAWTTSPTQHDKTSTAPLFLLFHGLEGSFNSPYANGLLNAAMEHGWLGVMMHFRGCSGELNRKPASYHSGHTKDARFIVQWLKRHYPNRPLIAVGISLGGNMLVNYLAQYHYDPKIKAAQIISAPLNLASCSKRIQIGFSRLYQRYLLNSLKANAAKKQQRHPEAFQLHDEQILAIPSLWHFDDLITAPLNGFSSAGDYYQRCSGLSYLKQVSIPCRIIHAADDPFMDESVIPDVSQLPSNIQYDLYPHGGHVGFLTGSLSRPQFWLEKSIPNWFLSC